VAVGLIRCGAELELLSADEGGDAGTDNGGIGEHHVAYAPSQEAIQARVQRFPCGLPHAWPDCRCATTVTFEPMKGHEGCDAKFADESIG
jgi:hypothetical protein